MENIITESLDDKVKQKIIAKLLNDQYGTFAKWVGRLDLYVTDFFEGTYIQTAAMFPKKKVICINPSFADITKMKVAGDNRDDEEKLLDQLCVLIRHELLHFLLIHQLRLMQHLEKTDPDLHKIYSMKSIYELANYAMDYEISFEGYDDHDKEVVRLMTLNNRVIGGLIAEDDHPEWGRLTMEEMFDKLKSEAVKTDTLSKKRPKVKVNVKKAATTSKEYNDSYNNLIKRIQGGKYSDGDIATMLSAALAGEDVIDPLTGEIILTAEE